MSVDAGQDTAQGNPQDSRARTSLDTAAARNLATTTKSDTADAGHLLALAAARPALGTGQRRHVPGQPPADLLGRRRPGDLRQDRVGGPGHPAGAGRDRRAPVVRRRRPRSPRWRSVSSSGSTAPGDVLAEAGQPADTVFLIAHGKVEKIGEGSYGEQTRLGHPRRRRPLRRAGAARRRTAGSTPRAPPPRPPSSRCPGRPSSRCWTAAPSLRGHLDGVPLAARSSGSTSAVRPRSSWPPATRARPRCRPPTRTTKSSRASTS